MRTVGVLLVLVLGATLLFAASVNPPGTICTLDKDNVWVCVTPSNQPVNITDWISAITPKFSLAGKSYGSLQFDNGYLISDRTVDGTDNQVAAWIIVSPKYLKPGVIQYTSAQTVVVALVYKNGSAQWNTAVDNAILAHGKVGSGGRFVLPSGFFNKLPKRK